MLIHVTLTTGQDYVGRTEDNWVENSWLRLDKTCVILRSQTPNGETKQDLLSIAINQTYVGHVDLPTKLIATVIEVNESGPLAQKHKQATSILVLPKENKIVTPMKGR